jgi:hypothetical protein
MPMISQQLFITCSSPIYCNTSKNSLHHFPKNFASPPEFSDSWTLRNYMRYARKAGFASRKKFYFFPLSHTTPTCFVLFPIISTTNKKSGDFKWGKFGGIFDAKSNLTV